MSKMQGQDVAKDPAEHLMMVIIVKLNLNPTAKHTEY